LRAAVRSSRPLHVFVVGEAREKFINAHRVLAAWSFSMAVGNTTRPRRSCCRRARRERGVGDLRRGWKRTKMRYASAASIHFSRGASAAALRARRTSSKGTCSYVSKNLMACYFAVISSSPCQFRRAVQPACPAGWSETRRTQTGRQQRSASVRGEMHRSAVSEASAASKRRSLVCTSRRAIVLASSA
jgi:hypothetical protein